MKFPKHYQVIVIGGGHAGIEAALASSRMGCTTLLLTINLDRIGWMSCNPAIGGPGKSQIVSEIDALGGEMARAADRTYLQMKVLNRSKGPAVQSLRAQSDKFMYHLYMKKVCEDQDSLDMKQDEAVEILTDSSKTVRGLRTRLGIEYQCDAVVVTTGTFLKGKIHIGLTNIPGGRLGEEPSNQLSDSLRGLGLDMGRLKTGTTPRLHSRSLDFSQMAIQPGDDSISFFSLFEEGPVRQQIPCYLTHTTEKTHELILNNLDRSPLYAGVIDGIGPRYCPSIEDKVVRFRNKTSHHLFVEPEGEHTSEIYMQGFNTSLPADIQLAALRTVPGLENVEIVRPGYAIEYDMVYPHQLNYNLETKQVRGLFLAGQINGTSGYEEAAGQGIIAGINAALLVRGKDPLVLERSESYIGVMIDDLINKDIREPYRMMTARAEYRLLLRQDNADERLTEKGRQIGLVNEVVYGKYIDKKQAVMKMRDLMEKEVIYPSGEVNAAIGGYTVPLKKKVTYAEFLQRVEVDWSALCRVPGVKLDPAYPYRKVVETDVKYSGYIDRIHRQADRSGQLEKKRIPDAIDYAQVSGLRNEAREKLNRIRPHNIGQASRISGVNPADISVLMVYLQKLQYRKSDVSFT